jgi:hypothetical protein
MGSAGLAAGSHIGHRYQGVASNEVINAVQNASAKTGADFSFLMAKASAESGFNPTAKASHSSARGLYQFISNTWLHMVKSYGPKFGLGQYADQIQISKNGKACVGDCKARDAILNLRNDPKISALMAGAFTAENKSYLKTHTSGQIGPTELSLAHFLGAGGAAKFLNDRTQNGDAPAAASFPEEAKHNKSVFYDAQGNPRSFNQIYSMFGHKFTGGTVAASHTAGASAHAATEAQATPAKASASPARSGNSTHNLHQVLGAQALSSFDDSQPHIIWSPPSGSSSTSSSGFSHSHSSARGGHKLDASTILTIAELAHTHADSSAVDQDGYNS